ncbi:MAG: methyltransferase [Saprospiraceae bacterium]|nr:methyltransferase [Saprospiraceae bacterium]
MKVGTDGILLGAWAKPDASIGSTVDIGTGTGLLALMIAQRYPHVHFDAIELDEHAAKDARLNFTRSPWHDRLVVWEGNALSWLGDPDKSRRYDFLISNPPFFREGIRSADPSRTLARHQDHLPDVAFWELADYIIDDPGQVDVILPAEAEARWCALASSSGFFLQRICQVRARPERSVSRSLLSFSRQQKPVERTDMTIRDDQGQQYSKAFCELTNAYYLTSC